MADEEPAAPPPLPPRDERPEPAAVEIPLEARADPRSEPSLPHAEVRPWAVTEPRTLEWRRPAEPQARATTSAESVRATGWSGLFRAIGERDSTLLHRVLVGIVFVGIAAFIAVDVFARDDESGAPPLPAPVPAPAAAAPASAPPPAAVEQPPSVGQAGETPAASAPSAPGSPAPALSPPGAAPSPAAAPPVASTGAGEPGPVELLARGGES